MQQALGVLQQVHTFLFVYGYGVLTAISILFALFFLWRETRKTSLSEERVFDIAFIAGICSLITGRALYFFTGNPSFERTVFNFFIPYVYTGFSFVGILVGFWFFMWLMTLRMKEPWKEYVRVFALPTFVLLLVQFILLYAKTGNIQILATALVSGLSLGIVYVVLKQITKEKIPSKCLFPIVVTLMGFIAFSASVGYSFSSENIGSLLLLIVGIGATIVCFRYKFTKKPDDRK